MSHPGRSGFSTLQVFCLCLRFKQIQVSHQKLWLCMLAPRRRFGKQCEIIPAWQGVLIT